MNPWSLLVDLPDRGGNPGTAGNMLRIVVPGRSATFFYGCAAGLSPRRGRSPGRVHWQESAPTASRRTVIMQRMPFAGLCTLLSLTLWLGASEGAPGHYRPRA